MDEKLHKKLNDRIEKGTLRSLSSFEGKIDFVSNDYLGLSEVNFHPEKGATGSRLISGNTLEMEQVELKLAHFFGEEAGLVFNSGYDANLGIFSSIPQKGDVVLYDEHIHASVRDGLRLTLAKSYSFKHNNVADLERLIKKNSDATIYIAIEGLYSMNGDFAPIRKIEKLADEYNAFIVLDEAHSAGVFGKDGVGVGKTFANNELFIRLVTFGKAYGGHGAVVLCSNSVRQYLINFARSFIYSTALPVGNFKRMIEVVQKEDLFQRRVQLQENLALFRSQLEGFNLSSEPNSPIQMITGIELETVAKIESELLSQNMAVKKILPPTVKTEDAGLRICMHSFNTPNQIQSLTTILKNFLNQA